MTEPESCPACGTRRWSAPRPGGFRFHGIHYRRVRCEECGLFGLDPLPAPELWPVMYADAYFDAYSVHHCPTPGYAAGREVAWRVANERLQRLQVVRPQGRLLDVGCAGGHFLAAARDRGYDVRGIEFSPTMAAQARATYGLDVVEGDVMQTHVDGPFDVIHMEDVVEHLRDPLAVLRKLATLLKDDGIFVIDGPLERQFNLSLALLELNLRLRRVEDVEMAPAHIWQFTLGTQRRLVERAGLHEVRAWVYQAPIPVSPPGSSLAQEARRRVARSVGHLSAWLSAQRALSFLRHGDRALVIYRRDAIG
jgi:SAM-dependent methyltransferase